MCGWRSIAPVAGGNRRCGLAVLLLLTAVPARAHIDNDGPDSDIRPVPGTVLLQRDEMPVVARFRGDCREAGQIRAHLLVAQEPAAAVVHEAWTCAGGVWTWRGRLRGLRGGGQVTLALDFQQWADDEMATHHWHGRDATWILQSPNANQ